MADQYALDRISDERTARIALSYAVPAGHELTGRILHQYGGLQAIQFARGEDPPGVDPATMRVWRGYFENYDPGLVTRGLELADQHGLRSLIPGDPDWPTGMDDLGDRTPVALWTRGGRPELLHRPLWERASIAGARAATFSGLWDAQQMGVGLALREITIVAASSRGVSRMALAGTLGGESGAVAVFGSGLDEPYPQTPNGFFDSIAENGMQLSETPPGIRPSRDSLQGMSRMVAALSAVTTVVESGARGQAMDTALHAKEMRRLVAAIRGPEDEAGGIGTNRLIDQGLALPVMDRDDIMSALESFHRKKDFIKAVNEPRPLTEADSAVIEKIARIQRARPTDGPSKSL